LRPNKTSAKEENSTVKVQAQKRNILGTEFGLVWILKG